MSKAKFDASKPYSTVHGSGKPKYLQDGVMFSKDGKVVSGETQEIQAPAKMPEKASKPKAKPPVTKDDKPAVENKTTVGKPASDPLAD